MSHTYKFSLRVTPALFTLVLSSLLAGPPASADTPPSHLSYTSPDTFYVGNANTNLTPTLTGGASRFTTAPSLPAGLTLNGTTGVISGTPTKTAAKSTYTITAANSAGSTSFSLVLTVDAPRVDVLSGSISRLVVVGTSVLVDIEIAPVGFDFQRQ